MKTKKSLYRKIAALTLLSTSVLNLAPTPSQAFVGAAAGSVPLVLVAAGVSIVSAGGFMASAADWWNFLGDAGMWVFGAGNVVGYVLLDSNQQISPQFTALTCASAKTLGITPEEMTSYNAELDQVNALYQTIVSDTEKRNQADTSAQDLVVFANSEWAAYGSTALSSTTGSALAKVRAGLAAQLNKVTAQALATH